MMAIKVWAWAWQHDVSVMVLGVSYDDKMYRTIGRAAMPFMWTERDE